MKIQGAARSRFAKECVKFLRAKKAAAAFRAYRPRMLTDLHAACRDSAEHFSRLNALLFTATDWMFIPTYRFAVP